MEEENIHFIKNSDLVDVAKKIKKSEEEEENNISLCPGCHCMTKSIKQGRAHYHCGKCGEDKSLSDFYFYESTHKKGSE